MMMANARRFALLSSLFSITLAACEKDPTDNGQIPPGAAVINQDITSNRTLVADTTYTISGFIHVANGATLTIQPGTRILGDFSVAGSALFVMRGARIVARGTAQSPIVFTSSQPVGQRRAGDWGGVVLVGNAPINRSGNVIIEGTGPTTGGQIIYSGGTNLADNSGELEYVRIEFAGYQLSTDNELNALTFAAVGSGTRVQYVQTLYGLDDSFEWFGGAVDGKYLISYESGDDHFDMAEGYRGRLQFLIGLQSGLNQTRPGAGQLGPDPVGIENDGCAGATGCDLGQHSTPLNTPVVANFTLIGRADGQVSAAANFGMVLRRGTGGYYVNGVLGRWASAGIAVRDTTTQRRVTDGDLMLKNILVADAPAIYQTGTATVPGVDAVANALIAATGAAALFTALPATPTGTTQLDWMPPTGSALRTGGLTTFTGKLQTAAGTFVTATSFRGAVDPAGPKWWEGWTNYATN
jgi:hypothetical protein